MTKDYKYMYRKRSMILVWLREEDMDRAQEVKKKIAIYKAQRGLKTQFQAVAEMIEASYYELQMPNENDIQALD